VGGRRSSWSFLQPLPVWSHFEHPEIVMPTNTKNTLDESTPALDVNSANGSVHDAARKAERMIQDGIEILRSHSRVYVDAAGQQFDSAQRYVSERVKERPMTATMAGVGVGLLLGLLLAGGRSRRSH